MCKKHFGNSKVVLTLAVSVGLSAILYVLHSLISYVLHVYRRKITNRNRKIASIDIKKEDNSLKFDDIVSSIKGTSSEVIYRGLTRRWSFIFFPKSFQNLSQNCKFLFCLYLSVSHSSIIKNVRSFFLKFMF